MSKDEELLDASSTLDFDRIKNLLADDACAGHQDPETGYGPLHKVVLAADKTKKIDEAQEILEYILANGGVWMQGKHTNCSYILMDSGSEQ
jgi:hypothetical protein